MTESRIAVAVGYIDDNLVSEAIEFNEKRGRSRWLPYVAITVCLCIIACVTMKVINEKRNIRTEIPLYGVLAIVTDITVTGDYEVKITGGDENFSIGDVVAVKCRENVAESPAFKEGDIIAITYSVFEKEEGAYEIIPGQIHMAESVE